MSRNLDWTPRVGMKVVCVNASPTDASHPIGLREAQIYTVEGVVVEPDFAFTPFGRCRGHTCIVLREVANPWDLDWGSFDARRFRPLEENHSGMEVLREILRTADKRIEEEA